MSDSISNKRQAGANADYVEVTPAMKAAGVERARELVFERDLGYFVAAVYMAMEYERRDSLKAA